MDTIIKHKRQKGAVLPQFGMIAAIVVLTIIIIWLLLWTKPQPQAKLEQLAPIKVSLTEVKQRDVQPFEQVTGRLQPIKTAQIRYEVEGKVVARRVEPGEKVSASTILMNLESADYRDQLQQVQAELVIEEKSVGRDKALLKFAQKNLQLQQQEEQRLQSLVGRNLIAQSQLDSSRQRVFDLQAEVARLDYSVATNSARVRMKRAQRDIAKRNLERTTLLAPFNGIINDVFVDEGDYVNANQVALTLVDTSEFDVQLDVRGEVLAGLALKQQVDVSVNQSDSQGYIVALQLDPDVNTNTHQVRVRVPKDNAQAGLLAVVSLPLSAQVKSKLIPVSSVLNHHGKAYVYTVDGNSVKKLPVELGRRIQNEVVVLSGLSVGQKIVARDVLSLIDSQQVITE
ncbi:MAG: efflux RND transporter periplasmic adaptor subunit [Gammaproteobacteria bacterium]|nr:efflux RND transporter periplasmic adaptor subunit [Gammaproteobacteria bacterium]